MSCSDARQGNELHEERPVAYSFFEAELQSSGKLEDQELHVYVYDKDDDAENPPQYPVPSKYPEPLCSYYKDGLT